MATTLASLPKYLQAYVTEQDYDAYSSLEHATWRYIMRQSRDFFREHAVPIYVDGLKKTGIPINRIPRISEMDQCLQAFGWGAAGVCGFIPSSVFLDLLAHRILPIATSMRTLEHLAYTPAPDIVHEAAGHAPIIADPDYRRFLESYAEIAYRALISKEDIALYEAIRYLSDIKENPDTPKEEIVKAEERLKFAYQYQSYVSEASKVARLAWWTIEYGLVGDLKKPKIYGAGLLSSVGESKQCLSSKIKKIPLTMACTETSYDITTHQPQLFVAESLEALPAVLADLANTFVYKIGGLAGAEEAKRAETVNTLMLESKLSVSGKLTEYESSERFGLEFIKFQGPVQISLNEKELPAQGRTRHAEGFSSPLGRFVGLEGKSPSRLNDNDLAKIGLQKNKRCELKLANGFVIKGTLADLHRDKDTLHYLTWRDCTVTRGNKVYFEPAWGEFDQVVGEKIISVFCGPADRAAFGDYDVGKSSTSPERSSAYSDQEMHIFSYFSKLRTLRQQMSNKNVLEDLENLSSQIAKEKNSPWLLNLEIIELAYAQAGDKAKGIEWLNKLEKNLERADSQGNADGADLINRGLAIKSVLD